MGNWTRYNNREGDQDGEVGKRGRFTAAISLSLISALYCHSKMFPPWHLHRIKQCSPETGPLTYNVHAEHDANLN